MWEEEELVEELRGKMRHCHYSFDSHVAISEHLNF